MKILLYDIYRISYDINNYNLKSVYWCLLQNKNVLFKL